MEFLEYVPIWQPSLFPGDRRRVANPLTVQQACKRALQECGPDVPSADRVIEAWMMLAPAIELMDYIPSIDRHAEAELAYRQHLKDSAAFESVCRETRPSKCDIEKSMAAKSGGWYAAYLQSEHWQEKRKEAHRRFGGECRACCSTTDLQVHHRHYQTLGEENVIRDLLLLCSVCHYGIHRDHDIKPPKVEPPGLLKKIQKRC